MTRPPRGHCWGRTLAPLITSLLLCNLFVGTLSASASAETCYPNAIGVPGLYMQPPHWTAGPPEQRTEVNDPRWAQSLRRSWGATPDSGTASGPDSSEVTFRGLHHGGHLYLQFDALTDPQGIAQGRDAVYVGFARQDGTGSARLLRVSPNVTTDQVASGEANTLVTFYTRAADASTGWVTAPPPPADDFLDVVGLWIDTTNDVWTVNLDIDLGKLGFGGAAIKTFYGFNVQHKTSPPPVATATQYTHPSTAVFDTNPPSSGSAIAASGLNTIDPTTWDNVSLGTVCPGGVELHASGIGTMNADQSDIYTNADNTFFATPVYPGALPGGTGLKATFRLANWGAQVGEANAAWDEFATVNFNSPNSANWTCTQASGANQCPQKGSNTKHQCMLVELTSQGDPVLFTKSSAWRNMDFETASTLERDASISLRGLPDAPGGFRDVYLYVKTKNMPPVGDKPMRLPESKLAEAARVVSRPAVRPKDQKRLGVKAAAPVPAAAPAGTAPAGSVAAPEQPEPPAELEQTPYETLSEVWPTYEVHAYYDTGVVVGEGDSKTKSLRPMVPFGYYISHAGVFYGWEHELVGVGSTVLEQLDDNWYRVTIQNGAAATVRSHIEAAEKPRSERPPGRDVVVCEVPPVVIKSTCHCRTAGAGGAHSGLLGVLLSFSLLLVPAARRWGRHRS